MHFKISSAKLQSFCIGLNVLKQIKRPYAATAVYASIISQNTRLYVDVLSYEHVVQTSVPICHNGLAKETYRKSINYIQTALGNTIDHIGQYMDCTQDK